MTKSETTKKNRRRAKKNRRKVKKNRRRRRKIDEGEEESQEKKKNCRRRKKKGNRVFLQFPNPRHLSLLGRPLPNWLNPNLAMYVVGLTNLDKKYLWFNMGMSISDHIYLDTGHPFIARPFDITNHRVAERKERRLQLWGSPHGTALR